MINRDDWLSPAAFVARIDSGSQSLNVQRSNVTDTGREAFRQTLADLGHAEATVFGHWALAAYDKVHNPELYAAAAARIDEVLIEIHRHSNAKPFKLPDNRYKVLAGEMEALTQEATRRYANPYIYDPVKRTPLPNPSAGPRQSKET
jgi:hypothetical protein